MWQQKFSMYLACLLRHHPELLNLQMDTHGWVSVDQLLESLQKEGRYHITREILEQIVVQDTKQRYRFSDDGNRIKACQGHSLSFVEPELTVMAPPAVLYHGTTRQAYRQIRQSGGISKMQRHAVHLQARKEPAWKSAKRWKQNPVILVIDSSKMARDGYVFGVSENGIWCTDNVPTEYIVDVLNEL